jgi:CheY-like chemotaxis protein
LVVDDSLEQAECLARLLEAIGHSATIVINPLDALDALDALQAGRAAADCGRKRPGPARRIAPAL